VLDRLLFLVRTQCYFSKYEAFAWGEAARSHGATTA
jgi:hypothetical protein